MSVVGLKRGGKFSPLSSFSAGEGKRTDYVFISDERKVFAKSLSGETGRDDVGRSHKYGGKAHRGSVRTKRRGNKPWKYSWISEWLVLLENVSLESASHSKK